MPSTEENADLNGESKPKKRKIDNDEINQVDEDSDLHSVIPDELWLRILGSLGIVDICRVGGTSRRYNILCKDPTLWKDLIFDWANVKRSLKSINKVLDRAIKVEKLRFTNKSYDISPDEKTMTSVIERVKDSLKVLILDTEIVPRNSAVAKFGCLSKLEVLDFPSDKLATSGVNAIAKLKNLRELRIPGCEVVTSKDLSHLFQELKNLVLVDLTDCKDAVTNGTIKALAKNNPNLEHLVLDECDKVQGNGLNVLGDNCKKLKYLTAEGCYELGDSSVQRIAKNCFELKHLSLSLCSGVRDAGIKALAQNCPKLQHLNLFGCTFLSEKVIKQIVAECKELKYICTRGILYISDQFIDKLRKEHPSLQILHKIEAQPRKNRSGGPLVALD